MTLPAHSHRLNDSPKMDKVELSYQMEIFPYLRSKIFFISSFEYSTHPNSTPLYNNFKSSTEYKNDNSFSRLNSIHP